MVGSDEGSTLAPVTRYIPVVAEGSTRYLRLVTAAIGCDLSVRDDGRIVCEADSSPASERRE